MQISVYVDIDQMTDGILMAGRDEAMSAILAIDFEISDAEFTETLITKLWDSLRGDLNESGIATILANLKKTPEER